MKRLLPFLIILAVLGVALGSAWYLRRAASRPDGVETGRLGNAPLPNNSTGPNAPALTAPGADPPHTKGAASASVTLEEFGDFECPPCAQFHPILKTMHEEFGDRVKIIFREYPLPGHRHGVRAASAAEAAGLQGKFWEMHHHLYDNQKTWHEAFDSRPIFEDYAKQIGLDLVRFQRDINSDIVARRIIEDGKRGRSLNLKGTPSVFMNGREVPFETIMDAGRFRNAINAELTKQGR
jgi:protein-disulfide isomerase